MGVWKRRERMPGKQQSAPPESWREECEHRAYQTFIGVQELKQELTQLLASGEALDGKDTRLPNAIGMIASSIEMLAQTGVQIAARIRLDQQ